MNKVKIILRVNIVSALIFGWLGMTQALYAQQVSGTVTDASSGESLPGGNVLVKGTTTGTTTDSPGSYEVKVPSLQDALVVSYIGYQTKEVPINGRTEIDIALRPQTIAGEEMVVVGYGTDERTDLTCSVGTVSSEDLTDPDNANVTGALQEAFGSNKSVFAGPV